MFTSLFKAALSVVTVPVAVVSDVVTFGGSLTDKDKPYTVTAVTAVSDAVNNLKNATKPKGN